MPNNITSFDIGESQVKVVTLSGGSVKKAVALELPDNVVSGGTVLSMDALADFLKEKLRASGPIKKDAAVILPDSLVFCRNITVPPMTDAQLNYNLPFEFKDYLNQEKSRYYFDYAVQGTEKDESGETTGLRLFACATLKKTVEDYRAMFYRAVDLGLWDLERQLASERGVDPHMAHTHLLTDYESALTQDSTLELFNRMAVEIMKAVNFYNYNNREQSLRSVYLCGGGAAIAPLRETVSRVTDLELKDIGTLIPGDVETPWLFARAAGCGL